MTGLRGAAADGPAGPADDGAGRRLAALVAVALVAVALVAVGCGSAPDLEPVTSQGITFERPAGWGEVSDLPRDGTVGRQAWVGPQSSGQARTGLFADVFCTDDLATVVDGFLAQSRRDAPSFEVIRRREPAVEGAEAATALHTTHGQEGEEGSVQLARFDLLAATGGVGVRLAVVGPADDVDDDLAADIHDSLALDPTDELLAACREPGSDATAPPDPAG